MRGRNGIRFCIGNSNVGFFTSCATASSIVVLALFEMVGRGRCSCSHFGSEVILSSCSVHDRSGSRHLLVNFTALIVSLLQKLLKQLSICNLTFTTVSSGRVEKGVLRGKLFVDISKIHSATENIFLPFHGHCSP